MSYVEKNHANCYYAEEPFRESVWSSISRVFRGIFVTPADMKSAKYAPFHVGAGVTFAHQAEKEAAAIAKPATAKPAIAKPAAVKTAVPAKPASAKDDAGWPPAAISPAF